MKKKPRFRFSVLLLILLPLIPAFFVFIVYAYQLFFSPGAASQAVDADPLAQRVFFRKLLDMLYGTVRVYSMEILDSRVGYSEMASWSGWQYHLLEFARWAAIIAVAMTGWKLFSRSFTRLGAWLICFSRHSFALHGDDALISPLKKELGLRAISTDIPEKFHATNHVLAFRDPKALYAYLDAHYDRLLDRKRAHVFICMNETTHSAQIDNRILISNMPKNCARHYWKKHHLRRDERSVVIIGMGRYGGQLLTQALQTNVYLHEREIAYHVFGDHAAYLALHPQLHCVAAIDTREAGRDSLFFHQEPWREAQALLAQADRIILCHDEETDNFQVMDYLLEHKLCKEIHVKVNSASVIETLWQHKGIVPFGTDHDLYSIEQVTHAALNMRARLVHAYYFHGSDACKEHPASAKAINCPLRAAGSQPLSACLSCPRFNDNWNIQTAYTRSSCVAQDDHADVKIRELLGVEQADVGELAGEAHAAYMALCDSQKRAYWALEHRRWMRFLHMHGWQFGETRNNEKLIHPSLRPFDELSEKEKAKDEDAFLILAEIGKYLEYSHDMIDLL